MGENENKFDQGKENFYPSFLGVKVLSASSHSNPFLFVRGSLCENEREKKKNKKKKEKKKERKTNKEKKRKKVRKREKQTKKERQKKIASSFLTFEL